MRCAGDTSVLVGFSGIDRLDILFAVFPRIDVVPAVYSELVTNGQNWVDAEAVQKAIKDGCQLVPVELSRNPDLDISAPGQGRGENEVIVYAAKNKIPALIDDAKARKAARRFGVTVVGTLGILFRAKQTGYIENAGPIVKQLRSLGIRFSDDLITGFLLEINEL